VEGGGWNEDTGKVGENTGGANGILIESVAAVLNVAVAVLMLGDTAKGITIVTVEPIVPAVVATPVDGLLLVTTKVDISLVVATTAGESLSILLEGGSVRASVRLRCFLWLCLNQLLQHESFP